MKLHQISFHTVLVFALSVCVVHEAVAQGNDFEKHPTTLNTTRFPTEAS
jgi:hypothetical protein